MYNKTYNTIFNRTSIGECITCPPCGANQYNICGGDSSLMGQCIDCTECPYGEYLKDVEIKIKELVLKTNVNAIMEFLVEELIVQKMMLYIVNLVMMIMS